MLELAPQALHVAFIVFWTLTVLRLGVVTATAREIRRRPMLRSRQCPVADRVSVHVFVAAKATELVEILLGQNLSTLNRLLWIRERIGHPVVHTQIEIGHYENYGLNLLRPIERAHRHFETLVRRGRKEHDVLGVAMRQECSRENVSLRR